MSTEKRPGGLTALAVINFVLGGLSLLGSIATVVLIPQLGTIAERATTQDMPPAQVAQFEAMAEVDPALFIGLAILGLVTAILLILSGVGYLKLKKFLGRTLGNTYAILGIASRAGSVFLLPVAISGGFNIMVIVGLIYPLLTLILLNTTFKEDFVN